MRFCNRNVPTLPGRDARKRNVSLSRLLLAMMMLPPLEMAKKLCLSGKGCASVNGGNCVNTIFALALLRHEKDHPFM